MNSASAAGRAGHGDAERRRAPAHRRTAARRPARSSSGGRCPAEAKRIAPGVGVDLRVDERRVARGRDLRRRTCRGAASTLAGPTPAPASARTALRSWPIALAAPSRGRRRRRPRSPTRPSGSANVSCQSPPTSRCSIAGLVGGGDLEARVRAAARPPSRLCCSACATSRCALVQPRALQRERRLLGAGAQAARAPPAVNVARRVVASHEPPAPVRRPAAAGADAVASPASNVGAPRDARRRRSPRRPQHRRSVVAPRDAGPASAPKPSVSSPATARAIAARVGAAASARAERCSRSVALARRALAVARREQLPLVALAVGRVEDGRADQPRLAVGVALEHRVDQRRQPRCRRRARCRRRSRARSPCIRSSGA